MVLKLYYDAVSEPARAIWLYLKLNNIPFEECHISLQKGEQMSEDFSKINPFHRIPVINDDGFILTESCAILKYLANKYNTPDHWYPKDIEKQIRVDEYLYWHQANIRSPAGNYFLFKIIGPMVKGRPLNEERIQEFYDKLKKGLDFIENVYLKDHKFLAGDEISFADLISITELDQTVVCNLDLTSTRPKMKQWLSDVKEKLQPHIEVCNHCLGEMRKKADAYIANKAVEK